jgi:hypothetical protein
MNKAIAASLQPVSQLYKLQEIGNYLRASKSHFDTDPSLSGGSLGLFLFFYTYTELLGVDEFANDAEELIQVAVHQALNYSSEQALLHYRALSELGALIPYLQQRGYLDESADAILEEVDRLALKGLLLTTEKRQFDPFTGYLSMAEYFLQRRGKAHQADKAVHLVIETLLRSYEQQADGYFWRSNLFDKNYVYTGWSHGVAAILLFLIKYLESGAVYRSEEVHRLIGGTARFLRQQKNSGGHNAFPDIVGQERESSTMNLCYGDLGLCYALWKASPVLEDAALGSLALAHLARAATRRDPQQCHIYDASLIYGASGNTLFFDKMHQLTQQSAYADAATYWYGVAQGLCVHPERVAGFKGHYNQHLLTTNGSLFEGVTGFGLTILEHELGSVHLLDLVGY